LLGNNLKLIFMKNLELTQMENLSGGVDNGQAFTFVAGAAVVLCAAGAACGAYALLD
jgi:hypothetical protein